MNNLVAVIFNGIAQLEYNRDISLTPTQALYLDKMDQKMDTGIHLGEVSIENPDLGERTQYVAANLASAIINDDEASCSALCSYLAERLPELKQIKIDEVNGEVSIEFIFDQDYKKQVPVNFIH